MNNSMSDDYFAFMSDKGAIKNALQGQRKLPQPKKAEMRSDTIEFVGDSPIEVTESVISDTMIEKIFRPR